jgi:Dirigent-like protein
MRGTIKKAALVASVAALVATLWLQTASSQTFQTLILNFPSSEPVAFNDGGRPGPGAGDLVSFRGPITDADGAKIGHMIAEAQIMDGKREPTVQIVATIKLETGSLAALGELHFTDGEQGTLAIVGGTGDLAGAAGSLTSTLDPETGNVTLEITLT